MVGHVGIFSRFKRHWLSAILFLIPLFMYLIGALVLHLPELYQHVMLTLTAVMGIHVLDRLFLIRDTEEALNGLVQDIRSDISTQTKSLTRGSTSLQAMDRSGIMQIYASRRESALDIKNDIIDSSNSKLRFIGISLNDFVQGMDPNLQEAWRTVQKFVRGERSIDNIERGLDIRALIIDPRCFGAKLRSKAESESAAALIERLDSDVHAAAKDLHKLSTEARPEKTGVRFECRLYTLPPIMFLCSADSVGYVQQYHFWSSRDNDTPTPVLKFRRLSGSASKYPYLAEMEHHFNWIWEHASVPVFDYLFGAVVGSDQGIKQCACESVFTDPIKARDRIVHLLKSANERVSIQGISLHSFFEHGPLCEALTILVENKKADLEVLLLDPKSDQAQYRSFKESLLSFKDQKFETFLHEGEHEKSLLYTHTERTIQSIRCMVNDIRKSKGSNWVPRLKLALYDSAPSCFVLRIDNRVFVEQYHYGKIQKEKRGILGKEMPLMEFCQTPSKLYEKESDPFRRPFALLVDHLKYVLSLSRIVDFDSSAFDSKECK
jgi:hypothetical protein